MKGRMRTIADLPEWRRQALSAALAQRVRCSDTECHLFEGTLNGSGYGVVSAAGVTFAAHRLAYELAHGPISMDDYECGAWWVLHACDVPRCCNPRHLYLGNPARNARDMADRCRMRPGKRVQCRWQSEEDAYRPTGTVFYEFQGQIKTLAEWSRLSGVNQMTLNQRFMSGWPEETIFRKPRPGFRNYGARQSYRRFSGMAAVQQYMEATQ